MIIESLLPPAATMLERALEAASASRVVDLDVPVESLWHPATIPAPLLPWLAWGLSVDRWNADWTEVQKRTACANAIKDQRTKGTPARLREILAGYEPLLSLVEWFAMNPVGAPHTFEVRLPRGDGRTPAARDAMIDDVLRNIAMVKPVRSHFRFVQLLDHAATVCLVAAAHVTRFDRLDAPVLTAPPLDWANFLQTEDGEPFEHESGSYLEVA